MKKIINIVLVCGLILVSCNNAEETSTTTPTTKVNQIDENCTKVEVTLYKGGAVVFTSSSRIKNMVGKLQLDRVTVYRVIGYSDNWEVDNKSPLSVDTTLLLLDGANLRKLEYRQGFVSAIYK